MRPAPNERRHAARAKVFEVSIITLHGAEHRAHLLDVSDSGARAHCAYPFRIGQRVTIRCDAVDRPARVCWTQEDGKLGIRYLGPEASGI